MELLLIRHGLPLHVENQDGQPADPPLSATGHRQAGLMAQWLAQERIDRLYSSPLVRARETALPLAEVLDLQIEIEDGVAEYDRHDSSYVPMERLKELDYQRWRKMMRGEAIEGFEEFSRTVVSTLERIVRENSGKRVAITCHGGVINIWSSHVIGMTPPRLFFNPDYTSINRFVCARSGERSVQTLNEAVHLRDVQG